MESDVSIVVQREVYVAYHCGRNKFYNFLKKWWNMIDTFNLSKNMIYKEVRNTAMSFTLT